MKKKVKKTGNSLGVLFTKEECEIYKLKEEDVIDMEFTKEKKK